VPALRVWSDAFEDGGTLPPAHTLRGGNTSPQLSWRGAPAGTRSYAVTCFDPDAPGAGFWHWAVLGIPPEVTDLPAGAGDQGGAGLPEGAFHVRNDFGREDYGGAAPPRGDAPHRYVFAVQALDTAHLRLPRSAGPGDALSAAAPHTLARGEVVARYRTP
jgi:hypothetical protein